MNSGQHSVITIWEFDVMDLAYKCPISCNKVARPTICQNHHVLDRIFSLDHLFKILNEFIERAQFIIKAAKHRNLVRYTGFDVQLSTHKLSVYLVQECINGISIKNLCSKGKNPSIPIVAKETLSAIAYLNEMDPVVTHNYLNDGSIFLDRFGVCRIADYDLVPYLMYLKGTHKMHGINDLQALGYLIESLKKHIMKSTDDFIEQCCSGRVFSHAKLSEHSFLSNDGFKNYRPEHCNNSLKTFDIEKKLGSGSFGHVLQAEQGGKSYAIKLIKIPSKENKEFEQMEREVEIISGMQHKNVVEYVDSWKETVNLDALKNHIDVDEFLKSQESPVSTETTISRFSQNNIPILHFVSQCF